MVRSEQNSGGGVFARTNGVVIHVSAEIDGKKPAEQKRGEVRRKKRVERTLGLDALPQVHPEMTATSSASGMMSHVCLNGFPPGIAGASLLASLIVTKTGDYLPTFCSEDIFPFSSDLASVSWPTQNDILSNCMPAYTTC